MNKKPYWCVFDVESVGLHGEGFAVGYVVLDRELEINETGLFACDWKAARGNKSGIEWCERELPGLAWTHTSPRAVRKAFWERWMTWRSCGGVLVAECGWPVEARFLAECVDDDPLSREWHGPYPMVELATLMEARGLDPMKPWDRLAEEMPAHNPLADSRLSARILIECLRSHPKPAGEPEESKT